MSNVNPNHYKVAGRERQGDAILQDRHRQRLADNLARQRFESRQTPVEPPAGNEDAAAVTAEDAAAVAAPTAARRQPAKPVRKAAKKAARTTARKGL